MNDAKLIHPYYDSVWTVQHIRNGKVIWEDEGNNSLVQGGEEQILETYFRATTAYMPTSFYVRLCNETLLTTSTLTSITSEPVGNGYAAQTLARSAVGFPTKDIDSGVYRLTSKLLTFTASGGQIGPVITAYLSTTSDNSGTLIAFRTLSLSRTIMDTDSMTITIKIKLS
jgi:hypothetical protein